MGHDRYAGLVTEEIIGGTAFLRVDVPECGHKPAFTKFFGASSIYSISPVAEDIARAVAMQLGKTAIMQWDLPEEMRAKLRAPAITGPTANDDEDLAGE
jgi:hypothetical protein